MKPLRSFIFLFTLVFLIGSIGLHANEVKSDKGVVSSRSQHASLAGVAAMAAGGNAVDAAVATAFALAVTHPAAGNLGGGGFMVIRMADGSTFTIDFREVAPMASSRDMMLDDDSEYDPDLALRSRLASGVPGSVAGLLEAHSHYGKLTRQQVMKEAIRLAERGFHIPEDIARAIADRKEVWLRSKGSTEVFLNEEKEPYAAGELFKQPDLAKTLKVISEKGRDGFYTGEVADLIVAEMKRGVGLISHEDLEAYQPVWREPIIGNYRGYEVISMPPPSSGGIILVQMLNMLELSDVSEMGYNSTATMHLMIEAERRAYADRAIHLGDPDFYPVPIETLIDKEYAKERISDMDAEKATRSATMEAGNIPQESEETTHLSVIDKDGNAVSLTTTLNSGYGSGYVVEGAGFLLNNEMDDFSSKPGVPNQFGLVGAEANAIEPGKRMLSSMTPTIVVGENGDLLVVGSPGGSTIITTVLQIIVNTIDHGMSLHDSVLSPRFHHQWLPDHVVFESHSLDPELRKELEELGHTLTERLEIGDANSAARIDGANFGVSDPRNAGRAEAEE